MKFFIFCISIIFFTACVPMVQPLSSEKINNADYGSYPENYKEIIIDYMSNLLFDPYSAVYQGWTEPVKNYWRTYGSYVFGHKVSVEINAKNRMGGYVGKKLLYFYFIDDTIIKYEEAGMW